MALMKLTRPMVMPVDGDTLTVVADVKLSPLIVTVVMAPLASVVGDTELITGLGGVIANVTALLVPLAVVTVMLRAPVAAPGAITRVAVMRVAVTTGVPLRVMSLGRFRLAPVRFVPAMVTATLAPCAPEAGVMEVSVGGAGLTVNVTALLVPPAVVTVMFRAPIVALDAITREAVI